MEAKEAEVMIALKAWLKTNSEFSFSDEDLMNFIAQKEDENYLCIGEDYSNYDSQKCNNGGGYGFWTNLNWESPSVYYISYHTTSDIAYCRACGSFCGHDSESCGYEHIDLRTKGDMIRIMERAEQGLLDELRRLREDISLISAKRR
jgi:hypothetical protein